MDGNIIGRRYYLNKENLPETIKSYLDKHYLNSTIWDIEHIIVNSAKTTQEHYRIFFDTKVEHIGITLIFRADGTCISE